MEGGAIYHVYLGWTLVYGDFACQDGPGPKDGASITYSGSNWEIDDDKTYGPHTTEDKRGPRGIIGKFRDPVISCDSDVMNWPPKSRRQSFISMDIEKKRVGSHKIWFTYVHSWAPLGIPGWISFGLAAGPIGVSAPLQVQTWKKKANRDR